MPQIDQDAYTAIQPELLSGESIVWAGQPTTKIVFHASDALMIPFSLLWGGFAIFWEAMAFGVGKHARGIPDVFFVLWGIPFVLMGQYMIWGRFVYAAWLKKRTYYAVTDRRALGVQRGFTRKTWACDIRTVPAIEKELRADGFGSLRFGMGTDTAGSWQGFGIGTRSRQSPWNSVSFGATNAFVDIEDADSVYRQINDLKARL
jgi:hypothetical protein